MASIKNPEEQFHQAIWRIMQMEGQVLFCLCCSRQEGVQLHGQTVASVSVVFWPSVMQNDGCLQTYKYTFGK